MLGPLEVLADDGAALPITSRRQRVLLTCLLLEANRDVSRDVLIDALWEGRPPPTAAKALQVQVHALRGLLGRERIVTAVNGYRSALEAGELDLARFERAAVDGRASLASGDAQAAAATLRAGLELWRGRPLQDVAYHLFAQPEVARLEELRALLLEERIEADLALARHVELVPELEALVDEHPLRERLQGQLMLALYRSGRQAEALGRYRRARDALRDSVGLEPGPALRDLQRAILDHDPGLAVEPPELRARRHLPAPITRLVGRVRELGEIDALLRGAARLVTVTGAGGIGKTRLAVAAAHDLADAFADGVHFVDLAHLREPDLVPSTIAHALGLEEHGDRSALRTLHHHLAPRALLLVLDNFEVVDEAAPVVRELLEAAPRLAALVTSRSPLRVTGEHEYRLASLGLPDAMQLFAARAGAVAPAFRRPHEESGDVAELCRRLDCLPLALELAAARTREYSTTEMLTQLGSPIELASGGARDLPARQRTLRATIDWSHALLDADEQAAFAQLAVFSGGCTAEAALAVCGAPRATLAGLAARSLLQERIGAAGGPRFRMLDTVHEYAGERLAPRADHDAVRRRHAEWFLALVAVPTIDVRSPAVTTWAAIDDDHDNLRAAVAWSHAGDELELELRLVAALTPFWAARGHLAEGRARCEAALAHAPDVPSPALAGAVQAHTRLVHSLGDYAAMRASAERALALHRQLGARSGVAWSLQRLGAAACYQGDYALGVACGRESVDLYRALGDERGLASALNFLAVGLLVQGRLDVAATLLGESYALREQIGDVEDLSVPLTNLGLVALLQERHADALEILPRALRMAYEVEFIESLAYGLVVLLAATIAAMGEDERAAIVLGAADAAVDVAGIWLEPLEHGLHVRTVASLRAALGEDAFAAAHAAGAQLDALEALDHLPRVPERAGPAAPRSAD